MSVSAEAELSVVRNSILVVGEREVLAAGSVLPDLLGEERVDELAGHVSRLLSANPDKTIPVSKDTVIEGIHDNRSSAVVGVESDGTLGAVFGFARVKDHDREGGEVIPAGVNLDTALEAGSMLGNGFALQQDRPVTLHVPPGQGSRALEAVVHLASWQHPDRTVIAATNQTNPGGAKAVRRAGGEYIGYKPTTRLEHPKPEAGQPLPSGPVMVDLFLMPETGNFTPRQRRRR